MFTEWTDPHDIDQFYDDVGKIFSKVAAYVDPSNTPTIPVVTNTPSAVNTIPVEPIANNITPVTNNATIDSSSHPINVTQNSNSTENKSGFEVVPNSIFIDDHPVGAQPSYNILRSGPPAKDSYMNRYMSDSNACNVNHSNIIQYDMITIILWFIIGLLIIQIINLSMTVSANRATVKILYELIHKKM